MVSMKDIAVRCGVSVATVSKALNGQQDIGDATRSRILLAAKEMGYMANGAARALKTSRSYNLGIMFSILSDIGLMHEYFASVLNSFRTEAERCGYDISFINCNAGPQDRNYLQHALYRGVDGVAIICADFLDAQVQELVYSRLPVVTLDHAYHNRIAVLSDNIDGMTALVRYVYEKGHRRIAYISGNPTAVTECRVAGFYRACEEVGIAIPDQYMIAGNYYEPSDSYKATKKLLSLSERPTCIFFPDDYSYLGGINAISEAGLKVPDDISAVGYDGIQLARVMSPSLTTWEQNTREIGKLAAAMLVEKIEHPRTVLAKHITVRGRLFKGETVRQLN